jgi:predicted nucleotidyltransferase
MAGPETVSVGSPAPQLTTQEILDTLRQHRHKLLRLGAQKLGLFGSYSRATLVTPESDLDILVVLEEPSFDSYMDIKLYLEDLFQLKVDLVLEENLKPRLRPYILNEVIYVT